MVDSDKLLLSRTFRYGLMAQVGLNRIWRLNCPYARLRQPATLLLQERILYAPWNLMMEALTPCTTAPCWLPPLIPTTSIPRS
jgi:hypothetical protein